MMSPDEKPAFVLDPEACKHLERALEADLSELERVWRPLDEAGTPGGLVGGTLERLRREGMLEHSARIGWRQRTGAWLGIAAALLLVAGLWQARERLAVPLAGALDAHPAWAEGLVLEECFSSSHEETETRLARVSGLLALEEESPAGNLGEAARLRSRLDRLAADLEAF